MHFQINMVTNVVMQGLHNIACPTPTLSCIRGHSR
jgi:hypothetical protein